MNNDLKIFKETGLSPKGLDRLLECSKEILLCYSLESKAISFISPSVAFVLGYSEEELLSISLEEILRLVHKEDIENLNEFIVNLKNQTGEISPFSMTIRFKNKTDEFSYLQITAIKDFSQGEAKSIYGLVQDVTRFIKAEDSVKYKNTELAEAKGALKVLNEELSALNLKLEKHNLELEQTYEKLVISEEIFRQLAENTNDMFWLRDEKRIIYINDQFEKIWGRKKEELIENPDRFTEWIHPDDLDNIEPWVSLSSMPNEGPYVERYRIVKPGGEVRWLWSRIFPVANKEGKRYRVAGITSDITEQKEFEDALLIAKEKAQESDMLKSTFLANISHEIRTPMNGIIGFAELISREDIDEANRKSYVTIMKKSSEQLIRIIDDIIDFAKLEANQIRIDQENVNLNRLMDQIFGFFSNVLVSQEKGSVTLLVSKSLSDSESVIRSDETRLSQIFSHLLDNACKFTSDGYIEFGYKIKKDKVEFFVKDSGIGITREKHELVFEQFRQGDEGHTRKYGGTGLGLPIAKGMVNLLGGNIWVESEKDKGSTFYFTIPYVTEFRKEKSQAEHPETYNRYDWTDKLILVAEDDELNFEYLKILLEPTLAKVIRAKDGSQAVKICSSMKFSIILMDIRLPVLNGIQATRQLREMGINTPIIAQTAFAMDDDEKKCLDAGCDRYLTKPIRKERLFEVIEEFI
jgi:PAS domain S-box-containing protein